jgi:hypothetical protein
MFWRLELSTITLVTDPLQISGRNIAARSGVIRDSGITVVGGWREER